MEWYKNAGFILVLLASNISNTATYVMQYDMVIADSQLCHCLAHAFVSWRILFIVLVYGIIGRDAVAGLC